MRFLIVLAFLPMMTFGVSVGSLPVSGYADTEVSTNIPIAVDFKTMSRVEFSLSLDASPTNCVEVSIGEDVNADGNLSVEEAAYTFGFDCGRWFRRSAADDSEIVETDKNGQTVFVTYGRAERNFRLRKNRLDEAWNLVKVTRRGVAAIGEVALVEGRKPGFAVEVR